MKRRQFTQTLAVLSGSLALPAFAHASSMLGRLKINPGVETLSRDFFETAIGQTFHLAGEDHRRLVLKDIQDACGGHCREQFHIIFEADPGDRFGDGIFRLKGDHSGHFDLYLSDSVHGRYRQQLVATINHQKHA